MKKSKSRTRPARRDFLKSDASNDRRKARQQQQARQQRPGKAANYDKAAYDGNSIEEEIAA